MSWWMRGGAGSIGSNVAVGPVGRCAYYLDRRADHGSGSWTGFIVPARNYL
jgi:hypothetical protein